MKSRADRTRAKERPTVAERSASTSRDLTVAATEDSRRAGARRSSRTRIGKIARLPNPLREELNRRLQDGEPGDSLLRWLNALPKVRHILAAQFDGRPISKQNLSEWKLGGYRDWERAEQHHRCVERLTEQAAKLAGTDEQRPLSERLAAVLLVELAAALDQLKDESLPPAERWQLLRQISRELAQIRREDNRAARLRIEQERWDRESDKLLREREEHDTKQARDQRLSFQMTAEAFGGGKKGWEMAARIAETEHGLEPGTLKVLDPEDADKLSPSKPSARDAKAESGKSVRAAGSDGADASGESVGSRKPRRSSAKVNPSTAQSNPAKAGQAAEADETRRQDAGGPSPIESNEASEAEGNDQGQCDGGS